MARIRTIKPEFFTSEDICAMSPLARLFFQACWCEADREGRFEWKPRTMKLRYFPADNCDIEALAAEVTDQGIVRLYTIDGREYAYIPSFSRHQHINPREATSTLPDPTEADASARVSTRQHALASVKSKIDRQVGREGKGKEGKEESSLRSDSPPAGFEEFWLGYPLKVGKPAAVKAFKAAARKVPIPEMLAAVKAYATTRAGQDAKFTAHPSTWLNQERWADDGPSFNPDTGLPEQSDAEFQAFMAEQRELMRGVM